MNLDAKLLLKRPKELSAQEYDVLEKVAEDPGSDPITLANIADMGDVFLTTLVGENPSTPVGTLEKLSTSSIYEWRSAVAMNRSTPAHLLDVLANEHHLHDSVAYNPSTHPDTLRRLHERSSGDELLRSALATNPGLPSDILLEYAQSETYLRARAVKNPAYGRLVGADFNSLKSKMLELLEREGITENKEQVLKAIASLK